MVKLGYSLAKVAGKLSINLSKIGVGQGGSLPGYVLIKLGGEEALSKLASEMKTGAVMVTGTNGKTTTTTLLIKLLSSDVQIRKSFENNTINSIGTGLLKQKGDLGVFEYGIRNMKYGIPDTIQRLIDPIGVVYTTISQEHTQVAGGIVRGAVRGVSQSCPMRGQPCLWWQFLVRGCRPR